MKYPLITVIIPTYNNASTIETAITSILNQTYPNIEIIIVNDNSTDGTESVVRELMLVHKNIQIFHAPEDPDRFDIKLNRNVNAGWSARNTGLKCAKGEYITFQDADDASLLNRIEEQYSLLKKYNSHHITIDWIPFDNKYLNKKLNTESYTKILDPDNLYKMSQRSKGFVAKISTKINSLIPFHLKRKRIVNKLFFGSLENYPGTGNSPLFRHDVIKSVQFRDLKRRVWPSFMGRGADKDFNFQVAETFKNSHICFIPLYMWRVDGVNEKYIEDFDKNIL